MKAENLSNSNQCSQPMNVAENFGMTGSTNPRTEKINRLSEIASTISKGTCYSLQSQNVMNNSEGDVPSSSLFLPHMFTPPAALSRDAGGMRMFAPPYQIGSHHVQTISVPASRTGTTLYYSQATRSASYTNFHQVGHSPTFSATVSPSITATPVQDTQGYVQVDQFDSLVGSQQVPSSCHLQLPCSPGYLQQHPSSSPTHLVPPSSRHPFQQNRSILISRSPETLVIHSEHEPPSPSHVRIQLSPILTQILSDSAQRKTVSDVVTSGTFNTDGVGFDTFLKDSQQLVPTSYLGYKLPSGKEGSLKHRILRPPSINIIDPSPALLSDAPLSAPPIRTHREPSPKQPRSIPSSGYRSFSSSASSLAEISNRIASSGTSPCSVFPNHRSSMSSGSLSPAPPMSPTTAQLKYPQSFMKGAIIQLANNQLKQVENMTTEDFVECGLLSPTLRIDTSTVVSIEKTPATGAAKLGFQVGQDKIQITVEAPLEHPFFVYKQGWSSCSPERSAQRYGLECHKLKVGDTCISLTDKPKKTVKGNINLDKSTPKRTENSQSLCLPVSASLPDKQAEQSVEKLIAAKSEASFLVRKRKRRWSAPDNIPQEEKDVGNE